MKHHKYFVLLDYSGEYHIPGIKPTKPIFSYKLLRNSLAEILSEIIRIQSATAGTWTYDSVSKLAEESDSFIELLNKLRESSEFPVRDSGARAAFIRLNMLKHLFTENEILLPDQHVTLHNLQTTARKMALTFYLVQLYNLVVTKRLKDLYIIVEEAQNVPEQLLLQLLREFAGYNVKIIVSISGETFKEWVLGYNCIIHNMGGNNRSMIYKHGIHHSIDKLEPGQAVLFWVEKHKWSKEKIKPSKLIEIRPKYLEPELESEPEEEIEKFEIEESEVEKENEEESEETEIKEIKEEVEEPKENVRENNGENDENKRDPRLDRIHEEHKLLSEKYMELVSEIGSIQSSIEDIRKEIEKLREGNLDETLLDVYLSQRGLLILPKTVKELDERITQLQFSKFEELRENLEILSEKVSELSSYIESFKEQLSELSARIEELNKKIEKPEKVEVNEIKIEDNLEEEKSFISKIARELNIDLEFQVHGDKIVVTPTKYLGEKFKVLNKVLKEHSYTLSKDKEYGWHWYKILVPVSKAVKSNA